jgi:asparagine synthase (glutamine-hydrolysing)
MFKMDYSIQTRLNSIYTNIIDRMVNAVHKRSLTTERPIACLLSGGLDSSLITALVMEFNHTNNLPPIETYSIGLEGSEDLKYAKIVAEYLGTKHHEIVLTETDFINAVPDVIRSIESYDTTSVRASIGNWLIGKYISENSEAKVIFNGDGSDELMGGYLYMGKANDAIEFDRECKRLLKDIHAFDVLRSDKCISSHGLEPRTPFLDRSWVQYYLSIPPLLRFHTIRHKCEKYLIRTAFSSEYFANHDGNQLLPDEILWRRKEAFSDGVTGTHRSLFQILQEHASECMKDIPLQTYQHNPPQTDEQRWYRHIFEQAYPNRGDIVPYFWMPKYVEANDASARTLDIY